MPGSMGPNPAPEPSPKRDKEPVITGPFRLFVEYYSGGRMVTQAGGDYPRDMHLRSIKFYDWEHRDDHALGPRVEWSHEFPAPFEPSERLALVRLFNGGPDPVCAVLIEDHYSGFKVYIGGTESPWRVRWHGTRVYDLPLCKALFPTCRGPWANY